MNFVDMKNSTGNSSSKGIPYLTGVLTFGLVTLAIINVQKTDRLADQTYQNLPAEIRAYDSNRDGYLDASELEKFARDFELKRK